MINVRVVKKVISLEERIPNFGQNRYQSYLMNPDFRKFVKMVISQYENKLYAKHKDKKIIQFQFSEMELIDNNLIPEWSDFYESMMYYLDGFGSLSLNETLCIGDHETCYTSLNISTCRGIIDDVGFIESDIGSSKIMKKNLIDKKFELLKILINDFEEMNDSEYIWFDFNEKVSKDELKPREVGD
jgi:hypothetical protein